MCQQAKTLVCEPHERVQSQDPIKEEGENRPYIIISPPPPYTHSNVNKLRRSVTPFVLDGSKCPYVLWVSGILISWPWLYLLLGTLVKCPDLTF